MCVDHPPPSPCWGSFVPIRDSSCGQQVSNWHVYTRTLHWTDSGCAKALWYAKNEKKISKEFLKDEKKREREKNETDNSLFLFTGLIPMFSFLYLVLWGRQEASSIFILIFKEIEVWATFLRSSEWGRQTPDPQPQFSTCSEQMAQGGDSLSPWRTEEPIFSINEGIYLDLKYSHLLSFVKNLHFSTFQDAFLCLVEFPLEFLQIRYTLQ